MIHRAHRNASYHMPTMRCAELGYRTPLILSSAAFGPMIYFYLSQRGEGDYVSSGERASSRSSTCGALEKVTRRVSQGGLWAGQHMVMPIRRIGSAVPYARMVANISLSPYLHKSNDSLPATIQKCNLRALVRRACLSVSLPFSPFSPQFQPFS